MASTPRILSVIGARPEIIQAAPVSAALAAHADEILVHTGQHYDAAMSEAQIVATAAAAAAITTSASARARARSRSRSASERLAGRDRARSARTR